MFSNNAFFKLPPNRPPTLTLWETLKHIVS